MDTSTLTMSDIPITRAARYYRLHRDEHLAKKKEDYAKKREAEKDTPEWIAKNEEKERKKREKEEEKNNIKSIKLAEKEKKRQESLLIAIMTSKKK